MMEMSATAGEMKMNQPMTFKGGVMRFLAQIAAAGPWRPAVERLTCSIGHRFPTSRTVLSFCRHFGAVLIEREGAQFERVVTFSSGGQMPCAGNGRLASICAMYYFVGTITNQDEDERPVVRLIARAVNSGDTFFDIGANVGFYSSFVGPLCGKSGAVHSFEANPLLIQHLRRSADLNKGKANIIVNEVAVGSDSNKTLQLYDPERIGGSSLYKLQWLNAASSVTVPLTTIDEYRRANNIKRLDVVKIDIEGAELDAFRGMEQTFAECPPWLILCELALLIPSDAELQPGANVSSHGGHPRDIINLLCSKGYEARYIREHDGRLGAIVESDALERLSQNLINVAFVRSEASRTRPDLFCA